jgi:hypothetical protein
MRYDQTIHIGEIGSYSLEAEYDYRVEAPYRRKHDSYTTDDIKIEKVEIIIKSPKSHWHAEKKAPVVRWREVNRVSPIDIPGWLWKILTSDDAISELELPDPGPDPDEAYESKRDASYTDDGGD